MVAGKPFIVAIIPARGGSKSIPRKNIKKLGDHPLIAYSIAAGLESTLVDRVIVSTDDQEIAAISKYYGAEVPFMRPGDLAADHVVDLPVFQHAVYWISQEMGVRPEIIIQLRPTSPFRPKGCVDGAIRTLLNHEDADSVRGVTPSGQNPYKMWWIEDNIMQPLIQSEFYEPYNMPRQELPKTYWQTGHVEAIRYHTLIEKESMTGDVILPYVIDPEYAIDLDTPAQWAFAEHVLLSGRLNFIIPASPETTALDQIQLVVSDFDGVMTDDQVSVDQQGVESVRCSRSDGLGIALLRKAGIPLIVLSTETNPVVQKRCDKLGIECIQGVHNKRQAMETLSGKMNIPLSNIAYVGNDVNDLPAMDVCGLAAAPANAHPAVLQKAHVRLEKSGGHGAVREFCEKFIQVKQGDISWM